MALGDPRAGSWARSLFLVVVVALSMSVVLVWSATANAGYGAAAAPTFPSAATIGETGLPASIQLRNNNTAPNTSQHGVQRRRPVAVPGSGSASR